MRALVLNAEERTAGLEEFVPHKVPNDTEVLVQVEAISLNPIDPLYVAHPLGKTGRVIGSDFAGVVVSSGPEPLDGVQPGQHVAGFVQGACSVNDRPGAFAEYVTTDHDLVWKIPDGVSPAEASGVSLVALTAAQGMWFRLGLQAPFAYDQELAFKEHSDWTWIKPGAEKLPDVVNIFIYGASTSVALYAAQMVRISAAAEGKKVRLFGTASKARWEMLKAEPYGYEFLVDYRDEDWPDQVRGVTGGKGVDFAYDCISENDSVAKTASTLTNNGKMAVVRSRAAKAWLAGKLPFEPIYGAVWEGLGVEIQYQHFAVQQSPAARNFAVAFYKWLSEVAGTGLQLNPIRQMPGGLEKVAEEGFKLLGEGKMDDRKTDQNKPWMRPVSAEKLVYTL